MVLADAAEELDVVNIHRDGMEGGRRRAASIVVRLRGVGSCVELVGDSGAGNACEQSRGRGLTGAALHNLLTGLPANGDPAKGADLKAVLKVPKGVGSKFRSELQ